MKPAPIINKPPPNIRGKSQMQDVQIDAIDDEIRKDDEGVPQLGSKTVKSAGLDKS